MKHYLNKLLVKARYKTIYGVWDKNEIKFDLIFLSSVLIFTIILFKVV